MILTQLIHLTFALAAVVPDVPAAAAAAGAGDRVIATYRADSRRFCVRPDSLGGADATGLRLYRRQCLTQRQWRERGIGFERAARVRRTRA
jgi:hypothetical protein